jgi:nucleoside-diphosphate-sugar epimerase
VTFPGNVHCAVTGASGFVGRGLIEHLRSRGIPTRALDRTNIPDFLDRSRLQEAFAGFNCVVHLLGRAHIRTGANIAAELSEFRGVNVDMALAAARAAASVGVTRFIYVSSVSVFGAQSSVEPISDVTPPSPATAYGISKLEAEDALEEFDRSNDLSIITLRPPLIYGPHAPGNFARLVSAVRAGWPLPFGLATENRRTFLSLDNLCQAIERMATGPGPTTGRFIVADDQSISTRATIEAIAEGMDWQARLLPIPPGLMSGLLSVAGMGGVAHQLFGSLEFDASALFQELDWKPSVSPREGLRQMGRAAT